MIFVRLFVLEREKTAKFFLPPVFEVLFPISAFTCPQPEKPHEQYEHYRTLLRIKDLHDFSNTNSPEHYEQITF